MARGPVQHRRIAAVHGVSGEGTRPTPDRAPLTPGAVDFASAPPPTPTRSPRWRPCVPSAPTVASGQRLVETVGLVRSPGALRLLTQVATDDGEAAVVRAAALAGPGGLPAHPRCRGLPHAGAARAAPRPRAPARGA